MIEQETRQATQEMEPETAYSRQLEARVQSLEAENKELRAALDSSNALTGISADEASVKKISGNRSPTGQILDHNDQIEAQSNILKPEAKIRLFRTRFAGRADMYARRWESRDGKKKGYAPVCTNEWREGICKKSTVRCHECNHRAFEPVTDVVMREHLTGAQVVGLYALDATSRCRFVAADFDHESWKDDTCALVRTCCRLDIPTLPEISRSGDGAHVWFFFDNPAPAEAARLLATALIERTCRARETAVAVQPRSPDSEPGYFDGRWIWIAHRPPAAKVRTRAQGQPVCR